MNIALTILHEEFEDFLNIAVFSLLAEEFELRRSAVGLPMSLDVAADLAELPASLMTRIEQQGSRSGMVTRPALSRPTLGFYAASSRGWSYEVRSSRGAGLQGFDSRRARLI
jgi:hypothetical protein